MNQVLRSKSILSPFSFIASVTDRRLSCYALRHITAAQMLNANAALVTIQDFLGNKWITTTQRYCRISKRKVQRDYYTAEEGVIQRTAYYHFVH